MIHAIEALLGTRLGWLTDFMNQTIIGILFRVGKPQSCERGPRKLHLIKLVLLARASIYGLGARQSDNHSQHLRYMRANFGVSITEWGKINSMSENKTTESKEQKCTYPIDSFLAFDESQGDRAILALWGPI